jgi:GNAT superfamily N-acetyltransferase
MSNRTVINTASTPPKPMTGLRIAQLTHPSAADLQGLAQVLVDCVEGGASVSFMLPISMDKALAFWQQVAQGVARGERALFAAFDEAGIVGTVQLILAQPDNQPHRADLAKMLVHRRARRMGAGAALLQAAETHALSKGKTLLVLDTASPDAERLYTRAGWQSVGAVPDYALLPRGGYCDTRFFCKRLAEHAPR